MYDVIIIGKGPAGISAALYALRAGMKTAVVGFGGGTLAKTHLIENYYGLEKPLSGPELQQRGERQYLALGGELIDAEVTGIGFGEAFEVETSGAKLPCKAVVIAVGRARKTLKIEGLAGFEGRGVSYCAVCDGFFFKGKAVGVIGAGDYALNEAKHLASFTDSVTLFTDGAPPQYSSGPAFPVVSEKIAEVTGTANVEGIQTADGQFHPLAGVFVAAGSAGSADFALKLGLPTENGNIIVDTNGMTALPGIFAAGDCTGGFNQIATAVGEGALAGQRAADFVKKGGAL